MEVAIEPNDLFTILQNWAKASGFSMHENGANRVVYSKDILGAKGWVSAENCADRTRIEAWQSSKSVGPEFQGNLLVGWKMPIPAGFAVGPNGVYRKQVHALFSLLESKSKPFTSSSASGPNKTVQPFLSQATLSKGLTVVGLIDLGSGLIGLVSASALFRTSSIPGLANMSFQNGLYDITLGTLFVICSRLLARSKATAIWLYAGTVLLEIFYSIVRGHQVNYFAFGFGILLLWQMLQFRKEWNLT